MTPILHGYWRSSAAYRVRLALAIKRLDYTHVTHDLRTGAQRLPAHRALAPQGLLPALATDDGVLTQSSAILEWLEEFYPQPPLLPAEPHARATVRAMVALIGCDIHPLGNLRVTTALRRDFAATDVQVAAWIARWTGEGLAALEVMIARHGAGFAWGDTPTLADCFLVPQLYHAARFGLDLAPYPHTVAAGQALLALDGIAAAHPDRQPDADPA